MYILGIKNILFTYIKEENDVQGNNMVVGKILM